MLLSLKEELACRNVGGILVFSCTRCRKTTRIISSAETSVDTVVTITWFSYCVINCILQDNGKTNDAMILPIVAWCYANNTERQLLLHSQNSLLWSQLHFCWRKYIQHLRIIAYSSWSCGTCNLMFAFQHFRTSARKTKEIVTDEWPIKAKKSLFWVGILDP